MLGLKQLSLNGFFKIWWTPLKGTTGDTKSSFSPLVIIQRAVRALVFELVAPPLEQIYTKPKQLGLVLEKDIYM